MRIQEMEPKAIRRQLVSRLLPSGYLTIIL